MITLLWLSRNSWNRSHINLSLSFAITLPILFSKRILITSGVFSTYAAACPSSQAFAHLSQVNGLSSSDNSSFKTQSHQDAAEDLSNFVIDNIFIA